MRLRLLLLAAVSCLGAVPHAFADPIAISRGTVALASPFSGLDPPFGFELFGNDTAIAVETFAQGTPAVGAGTRVDLSTTVTPSQFLNHPLRETVNGAQFDVFLSGGLNFNATPFIVPATISGSFTTLFTMSGVLSGFSDRDRAGLPLFTANLAGHGTASLVSLRDTGGGSFLVGSTVFTFSPAPVSPTPEPRTLVMLVGGLACVAFLFRRRAVARM
ncbi:MAG: hypothetical protein AUI11_06305 [Acidobacteria bacterium 13_2_20CM_2_66_4]|nr:MAG: hypothetical protein AUI11_06305 [Acidobacteria bacterium 13_2_20CM_2_66_4]